jgi:hypothetical protein
MTASIRTCDSNYASSGKTALWCRSCVEQFGLLPILEKEKNKVIEPEPTLEDLLRAIIKEEIAESREGQ